MSSSEIGISVIIVCFMFYLACSRATRRYDKGKYQHLVDEYADLKKAKQTSITINIIWLLLLFPVLIISYFSMYLVVTIGEASRYSIIAVIVGTSGFLFLSIPISIIICIGTSMYYRKEDKVLLSILTQQAPLFVILYALLFLACGFISLFRF
ncbi:MAG: hypothetical protein FWG88_04605 [Oscillospiraceae bacterium]|nr:hypothetical protein [Oscillospiraceae bacterium]